MRQPYTYSMPESFLKDKSVPARWRVLGVINGFIINGGCFYGSNKWLMEQLGCSETTISSAFAELEELNVLKIVRTARTRKVYRKAHDPSSFGSETQVEHSHDPSQLAPNSVSNSVKENSAVAKAPRSYFYETTEEPEKKKESRSKDKESIYKIFSAKPQPWWIHTSQKESALRLFDLYGTSKIRTAMERLKEHQENGAKFAPRIRTPLEYEQKMLKLKDFLTDQDL